MADYFIVLNGKPEGPYPLEQLKERGVRADTFVKTTAMDDYKEADELPELREILNLKQRNTLPQYFATLDIRLLAVIIDYLLLFLVFAIMAVLVLLILNNQENKLSAALIALIVLPISKLIYGAIMESSFRQGTFGKVWLGIKVTDEGGNRINLIQGLVRNFSKLLCVLTLGVGYLMGFFDKRQQCLHDRIAGTLVIKGRLI